jgi:hypothetical protein
MPVSAATWSSVTLLPDLNDRSAIRSFNLNLITTLYPWCGVLAVIVEFARHLTK